MRSLRAAILFGLMLLVPLVVAGLASLARSRPAPPGPPPTPGSKASVFSFRGTTSQGEERDIYSILPPGAVFEQGLARECIIGESKGKKPLAPGDPTLPENFTESPFFADFLHKVIAEEGPEIASVRREAKQVKNGPVLILDERRDPDNAKIRDLIGMFTAKDGEIVAGSYQRNKVYQLLTPDGFFILEPAMHERLLRRANAANEAHRQRSKKLEGDDAKSK